MQRPPLTKEVTGLQDGETIRCMHCHGEVRIHRKGADHGPQDHAEHLSADDSRHCRGGAYFKGADADHRMSPNPVA